jgi:acyl-CoA synthetase (AMP-forming)/AMP-acid ligase II
MRVIDYFDKAAGRCGDQALVVADEATYTYGEARESSERIACSLRAIGAEVGDRVGILAPNVPEALLTMLGIWRAGAVWVPLNPRNAPAANVDFMNEVGCTWLFLHSSLHEQLDVIGRHVPTLRSVVCLDEAFDGGEPITDFLARGGDGKLPDWGNPFGSPELPCVIWPTGGTTGNSKAVIMTNQVWSSVIELASRHWPRAENAVNLMVAPITHAAGVMAMVYASLGATIVMRHGFDASEVLDSIEHYRVTHMFLPPTAYYAVLDLQRREPRDCGSLRMLLLGGAPVSPQRFGAGVAVFGPCLVQCWGQTESPFMLTWLGPDEVASAAAGDRSERLASCGRPTFSSQVVAMDKSGTILEPGQVGELVARGHLVSPGYLGRPEATAEVRTFGWHHTGDVGYVDDDGYVYIVDRMKDMVITGGFNVYCTEVEAAIMELPEVLECAVIGVPDDKWGEAVLAVVASADPGWRDDAAVIAAARKALGSVKAPKHVEFARTLPKTTVGKIDKGALRARYWAGHERAVN